MTQQDNQINQQMYKLTHIKCKSVNIPCDKIICILYESLSKDLRNLEKNYISLLIPLISALGVFGYGLKEYLSCEGGGDITLFTATTFASLLILILIWFSSNYFGYTHRSIQIVLSRIEDECCLYNSGILPKNWNLFKRISECNKVDPPDIYKLFKLFVVFTSSIILIFYFFITELRIFKIGNSNWLMFSLILVMLITLIILNRNFRWSIILKSSYLEKLKNLYKLINEEEKSCEKFAKAISPKK